jgi:hypothetical protein
MIFTPVPVLPVTDPAFFQFLRERRARVVHERWRLDGVEWRLTHSREVEGWRSASAARYRSAVDQLINDISTVRAELESALGSIDRALARE